MISTGEKPRMVTIEAFHHPHKPGAVSLYFYGLATIPNPISCTRGEPESMGELCSKLEEILGVKISCSK